VDGSGLAKIEDKEVAKKIKDKVNAMNIATAAGVAVVTAVYCSLPPFGQ